jgi:type I restriction enzyme, S subunit
MSPKTPGTVLTAEAKPVQMPRRRFTEFAGQPWEPLRLADVTAECTTRNSGRSLGMEVMGVTKAEGIVPMEERVIAADRARYKVVSKDWFAYNPMRLNIGSIARWHGKQDVLVSPDYVVFRCSEDLEHGISPDFLDHFRTSDAWQHFVNECGLGSVRVRIYYKDIARLELQLPTTAEQQKIADCLSYLDELIAAQGRKVEALKTHKKGLMQQLFPREGETQPRLRFPEFRNAGEWTETRLGQIGELISGLTYSPDDVRETGLLVLRSSNVQNGEIALDDNVYVDPAIKGANHSKPNDILICVRNGSKALIGKSALIPDGMPLCTHGAFMTVFRAEKPRFVFQLFQTDRYQRQVAGDLGATINSINGSQLLKYKFVVPKPAEQQRIASCLSTLDNFITAAAADLETLKVHKKGLMQRLFPAPEPLKA